MVNEPRCDYHKFYPESIGWFLEDQAFSLSYDLALPCILSTVRQLDRRHTGRLRKRDNLLTEEGGWVRSQIIRRRKNLVLYKSFNTLWFYLCVHYICRNVKQLYVLFVLVRLNDCKITLNYSKNGQDGMENAGTEDYRRTTVAPRHGQFSH
jgi:hypothetical protein